MAGSGIGNTQMSFTGIDAITFGVADIGEAQRFLDDWGTTPISAADDRLAYQTRDGGEVFVRKRGDADLPAAIEAGNTVVQVVWGAEDQASLDATIVRFQAAGIVPRLDADGTAWVNDPNGLSVGLRVSRRRKLAVAPTLPNGPGVPNRIDARSPVYERAEPVKIGHVVLFAADFEAMCDFYTRLMGFTVSDQYPGFGMFLRCKLRGEHHNLFVVNRAGKPGVNHVAFTVSDVHEVIGGGIAMSKKGWKTEIGPGRHPISSAYFWYFHNPLCAPLEYYADDDFCTEAWQAQSFVRAPELFAEWAIAGGIDGTTRRQTSARDDSGRGHP